MLSNLHPLDSTVADTSYVREESRLQTADGVKSIKPFTTKSTSAMGSLIAGALAGMIIGALGAINLFGPVNSTGFIVSLAIGGNITVIAIGGLLWIVIRKDKKQKQLAPRSEIESLEKGTNIGHAQTEYWWQRLDFSSTINAIDQKYNTELKEGYSIQCNESELRVLSCGNPRRKGEELGGVPDHHHPNNCAFCHPLVPSVKDFQDQNCRLIASKSNTPLLIPSRDPIPVHWFQADIETKKSLFNAMQEVLNLLHEKLPNSKFHFELHCGAAGSQTVGHLHLRIHREGEWKSIDWKPWFHSNDV